MTTHTWKEVQAISGLAFGSFLVMHFLCHYSLSIGWQTAQDRLLLFRTIYQHPVFEISLVVALATHMTSNTVLYMRRKHEPHADPERTAHHYAGYIMVPMLLGHVIATRIGPLVLLEDPDEYDYSFVSKAVDLLPKYVFPIYLALFGMAAGWHFIYGVYSSVSLLTGHSALGKPFPMVLKNLAVVHHAAILSAVLALTGYYYFIDKDSKAELHKTLFEKMGMHYKE
jgi:hypothetical protein